MKKTLNRKLIVDALIVAIYVVISLLLTNLSFGFIQIRVAELLLVLCLDDFHFTLPITLGCLLTNIIGVANGTDPLVLDIVIGSLATFLSCIGVYEFRNLLFFKKPLLSLLMPVLINGIMVGLELSLYFKINVYLLMGYVALGEFVAVFILGLLLYEPLIKVIRKKYN